MLEFRFAFPLAFLLLVPAALLLLRWWNQQSRQMSAVLRYSDTRLLGGLPVGLRVRLRRSPDVLRLVAWLMLVIALARPQFGSATEIFQGEGINIMLAMDISDSMAEADFNQMSRFDAAKQVMRDFIDQRTFDSIGLVVFAEDAFYQAPPTLDYFLLQTLLDDVPLAGSVGLSNRTAIGQGIAMATNVLRDSDANSNIIILLTDGANNAGEIDPISAAQAANAFGIRIYTIGIGSSTSSQNELDEDVLRQIARITDGRYFNALSLEDLQEIYSQIDLLEPSSAERQFNIRWQEQAHGFLLAAFVLLIIERTLRHTLFQTIP